MNWQSFLTNSLFAALIVAGAILLGLVADRFWQKLKTRHHLPDSLALPVQTLFRYGLILLAFFLVLTAYQINLGNFWTLISAVLGLIAIGFVAVWSVLSNISASFLILVFKPFRMGDTVEFAGETVRGRVISLSLLFTTLEQENRSRLQIPNNLFFQKVVRVINPALPPSEEPAAGPVTPDHSKGNLEGVKGWESGRAR